MSATDPLTQIENRQANHDIGVTAYHLYDGARSEGASRIDAALIVYAWIRAGLEQPPADTD